MTATPAQPQRFGMSTPTVYLDPQLRTSIVLEDDGKVIRAIPYDQRTLEIREYRSVEYREKHRELAGADPAEVAGRFLRSASSYRIPISTEASVALRGLTHKEAEMASSKTPAPKTTKKVKDEELPLATAKVLNPGKPSVAPKVAPKAEPKAKTTSKVEEKPKASPKAEPKGKATPKVEEKPKVAPKTEDKLPKEAPFKGGKLVTPAAEKPEGTPKATAMDSQKIVVVNKEHGARPGSQRARNMDAIIAAKTVGEARATQVENPSGDLINIKMVDINLAVSMGIIKLG